MKTRDEFIASVWEKSEKALAEKALAEKAPTGETSIGKASTGSAAAGNAADRTEKRTRRKQIMRWITAAAACLIITAGVTLGMDAVSVSGTDAAGDDGLSSMTASTESADNAEGSGSADSAEGESNSGGAVNRDSAGNYGSTGNTDSDSSGSNSKVSGDHALSGAQAKETEDMDSTESYYMLPAGIRLEDLTKGTVTEITGDGIDGEIEYMQWLYNLPEGKALTAEEYEKSEPKPAVRYKFTMDFSLGEDTEGVDRIYYILDGVELP